MIRLQEHVQLLLQLPKYLMQHVLTVLTIPQVQLLIAPVFRQLRVCAHKVTIVSREQLSLLHVLMVNTVLPMVKEMPLAASTAHQASYAQILLLVSHATLAITAELNPMTGIFLLLALQTLVTSQRRASQLKSNVFKELIKLIQLRHLAMIVH